MSNNKGTFLQRMRLQATAVLSALTDLTTDAVPDKPRQVKARTSLSESFHTESTDINQTSYKQTVGSAQNIDNRRHEIEADEDLLQEETAQPKSKHKSKQGKKKKGKNIYDIPEYKDKNGTYIVNSVGVHVGNNNFYRPEVVLSSKKDCTIPKDVEVSVDLTEDITDLMSSKECLEIDHITEVSQHIGVTENNWINVGKKLGYSLGQLNQLKVNYQPQSEVIFQMILQWKQDKTEDATLGELCRTLWTCNEKEAVERLSRFIFGNDY